MWEQRYGFPEPGRTPRGYRRYTRGRRGGAAARRSPTASAGLSVPAALERARAAAGATDRPSIYGAVAARRPRRARRCCASRTLMRALPGDRGRDAGPRRRADRVRRLPARALLPRRRAPLPAAGAGGRRRGRVRRLPGGPPAARRPVEIPIARDDALGNEWAVVVDAPGYAACLLAWEQPGVGEPGGARDRDRRFEAIWTLDPGATRRAAQVAARLAGRADPAWRATCAALLADRPLALEEPAPGADGADEPDGRLPRSRGLSRPSASMAAWSGSVPGPRSRRSSSSTARRSRRGTRASPRSPTTCDWATPRSASRCSAPRSACSSPSRWQARSSRAAGRMRWSRSRRC